MLGFGNDLQYGAVSDPWKFVIISYPRTGSNLLCSLLDSHPDIVCHYELFNDLHVYYSRKCVKDPSRTFAIRMRNRRPKKFLKGVFSDIYNMKPRAVGFKIFFGQNDRILEFMLKRRDYKKIILYRENMLENYYSMVVAKNSRVWSESGVSGAKNTYERMKITVNINEYESYYNKHKNLLLEKLAFMDESCQRFVLLEYNNVLKDIPLLLNYLYVDPEFEVQTNLVKQNRYCSISDVVLNYDEILKAGLEKLIIH